jgi:alkanesulfonate monooxygenase SsuD/methylene tetrahydromethanopterin reductase-like flavin-dependent oxidoreductase (luciferase family)
MRADVTGYLKRMGDESSASADREPRAVRLGLSVPNMAEPSVLVAIGERVEAAGWDGVFLWDHVHGSPAQPLPIVDPWVVLGALAARTSTVRLGTTITAVPRRRPQELARQVVALDRLSDGRAVLGVGLGEPPDEYTSYGDTSDRRDLAARLDEGLEVLAGLWTGEPFDHRGDHYTVEDAQFVPRARQEPRVPVWTSCVVQNEATLSRAARWDGVILAALEADGGINPVPVERVEHAVASISGMRPSGPYDVAVTLPRRPDDSELGAYAAAGATWILVTGWVEQLEELVGQLD